MAEPDTLHNSQADFMPEPWAQKIAAAFSQSIEAGRLDYLFDLILRVRDTKQALLQDATDILRDERAVLWSQWIEQSARVHLAGVTGLLISVYIEKRIYNLSTQ